MHAPHLTSAERYPVLRSLAILYVLGAAIVGLGGVVAILWALLWAPYAGGDRVILAGAALAGTCFVVISLLAIAEVLKLFIDVEHSARLTAMSLAKGAVSADAPGTEARAGRLVWLEGEETAEGALLRGH